MRRSGTPESWRRGTESRLTKERKTVMGRQAAAILTVALGLGLGLAAGPARADGPGAGYGGEEIGTIRYLDRAQNLVVLSDGNEFHATDARMLSNLQEGELVKVDFTHDNDRSIINFIEPADANSSDGAIPGSEAGPHEH
jgi:hypothetical protein